MNFFNKIRTTLVSQAGGLLNRNDKARDLFRRRMAQSAHEQLIENNENDRPVALQQEKYDILMALIETALNRIEAGLYSQKIVDHIMQMFLETKETINQARDDFVDRFGRLPPGFLIISPSGSIDCGRPVCRRRTAARRVGKVRYSILERIVSEQARLWGSQYTVLAGGEPAAYRSGENDILRLAEHHPDHLFLLATPGGDIDDAAAQRMAESGNVLPLVWVDGLQSETERIRGMGEFDKMLDTLDNLRKQGIPFGIILAPHRQTLALLTGDALIDFYFDQQEATLAWVFPYCRNDSSGKPDHLMTSEQRRQLLDRERQILREKGICFLDLWNDAVLGRGCSAAGRPNGYFYIDGDGGVMPCPGYGDPPVNIYEVYQQGGDLNDIYAHPSFESIRQRLEASAQLGDGCETADRNHRLHKQ